MRSRFSSRSSRACWPVCALVALALSACASLDPAVHPPDYTPPPTESLFWEAVGADDSGDWHALLNEGPVALDWRLRALDSAQESVDLQTFLWAFDTAGSLVLERLILAAERGVQVRILIDDIFLVTQDSMLLALAEHPNIEYRVFNPFKRRAGGLLTRQLLNAMEFSRLDHRMHNKAMVVDNRIAVVGGRNLADEYFGLHDTHNFRDLELILGGPVVTRVSAAFDDYWNNRWSVPIGELSHANPTTADLAALRQRTAQGAYLPAALTGPELVAGWQALIAEADRGEATLLVDEPPHDRPDAAADAPVQVADELVALVEAAEDEVVIVSPYLIPTPHLEGTVARAIERGVRVRILTNSLGTNNHMAAHSAYRNHIGTLIDHGAELHEVRVDAEHRANFVLAPVGDKVLALHAKTLLIDSDRVFIGSPNLDPRSLRINTEMGFLVESSAFNEEVRAALEEDFSAGNAWRLERGESGALFWVSGDTRLSEQPHVGVIQRLEDWFISLMPIEGEL